MSNRAFNRLLKEYPFLYFVVAVLVLGGKAMNITPTGAMSWTVIGVVSLVLCALGGFGMRSKMKNTNS